MDELKKLVSSLSIILSVFVIIGSYHEELLFTGLNVASESRKTRRLQLYLT